MFSKIKRLLGNITVKVNKGIVYVDGIPADIISREIKAIWGTSRIEKNLFNEIDENSFSFNEYFCIEVVYALDRILETRGKSVRTLSKVKEMIINNTWLADAVPGAPGHVERVNQKHLDKFYFSPLPHQQGFLDSYSHITHKYELNGMLLAAAAGSGKTILSLMLMECLEKDQIIIISPNNALYRVWETTLKTAYKHPGTFWISKDSQPFKGDEKYIVINFEYLGKFIDQMSKLKGKNTGIILDESHNFNTHDSLRTLSFVDMCAKFKKADVLWMSGTPIKALATEAIPLFRTIDPKFTPDTESRFRKIFGVSSERGADILKNRLGFSSFKVEKKELAVTAPIFKEIKVKIEDGEHYTLQAISKQMFDFTQERKAYYRAREAQDKAVFDKCINIHQRTLKTALELQQFEYYRKCLKIVIQTGGDARVAKDEVLFCNKYEASKILPSIPKELKSDFKDVKSIIKYVALKIQGECLGRVVGRARINAHVALCDHIDYVAVLEASAKKTLVFTSFVQVIEKLQTHLPEIGLDGTFVYAKTNSQLGSLLSTFETNADKNPLVATYASLSTAVPLLACDQVLMIDSPYRDYVLQQAISRVNRIGATTQTYVYTVMLDTGDLPNISSRSFDIMKWSQSQIESITGVTSPFVLSDDPEQANMALEGLDEGDGYAIVSAGRSPNYLSW